MGLLFLPIPLVEAYAKAGLARMQGTVHADAGLASIGATWTF